MSVARIPWTRAAALTAAFLGGGGAVAAEVVFTRRMAMLFGVTAPAVATVVAVYLAGMALGSVFGGRLADRLGARAPWLYLGAEAVALVWAVAFLPLAAAFDVVSLQVPLAWTVPAAFAGTVLLVGPAALASGATFPALARVVGSEADVRRLVAANTLGAASGSVAAGFWLPHVLGFQGTLWLAGGVALLAGVGMVAVTRGRAVVQPRRLPAAVDAVDARTATVIYGTLGATAMVAEIGWTRLLEQTGPNPGALTFPLVLACYLVGYGVGGLWVEPRLRRTGETRGLVACAAASGVACVLGVGVLPWVPPEMLMGHAVGWGPFNEVIFAWTGLQVSYDRLLIYALATAIPGVASGAGFPLVASAITRATGGLGAGVGSSWAAGTAAAVCASLWMGFMPGTGPGTVHLVVIAGVASLSVAAWASRRRALWVLPVVGATALAVPPEAGLQIQPGEELLHFVETAAGPSAVTALPPPSDVRNIYTHGERVSGFALDLEVPLLLHPRPERVLLIAFGTGVNVRGMLADPAVAALTCVDIDPALPGLAAHIPDAGPMFADERATFVHADGRHFLRLTEPEWDIIYDDVATYAQYIELGTVEFFELARSRLAPGGMFVAKVHSDTLTPEGQARFLHTFLAVFPRALLFDAHGAMPVLVGTVDGSLDHGAFVERASAAREVYGTDARRRIEGMPVLDAAGIARLAHGPVSTDDRPMAMRVALVGPYSTPESYTRSGQTPYFAAVDTHGDIALRVAFGVDQDVPRTEISRPHEPPVPPPRRGWLDRGVQVHAPGVSR